MKRILSVLAIIIAASFASAAHASNCAIDQYDHNGSVMEVQICDGGTVAITYVSPRSGMVRQGVRNGTLLFDGFSGANGQISGTARLFSARCGVITYLVSGSQQGNTIILRGTAGVRGSNCRVARYRQDTLVFSLLGGGGPPVVQPTCPAGYILSGGRCILAGGGPAPQRRRLVRHRRLLRQSGSGPGPSRPTRRQIMVHHEHAGLPQFPQRLLDRDGRSFLKGPGAGLAAQARRFGAYVKRCH